MPTSSSVQSIGDKNLKKISIIHVKILQSVLTYRSPGLIPSIRKHIEHRWANSSPFRRIQRPLQSNGLAV